MDFARAFDSINHEALQKILNTFDSDIKKGVKQGCILSLLLFNMCLDTILAKTIEVYMK